MNSTFIEAVAVGIVPGMNNRMVRATFEYSGDSTLVLEGDALQSWLSGYVQLIGLYTETITRANEQPSMTSDTLRSMIKNSKNGPNKQE